MARDFKTRPTVNGVGVVLQNETIAEVELAADVANANATANTFQDVTGLSFSAQAGLNYRFRFTILYTAAVATTGSRWSLNGPASPTFLAYIARWSGATAGVQAGGGQTGYNLGTVTTDTPGLVGIALIEGIIRPSAAGVVVARFASEIASSAITAKVGSTLEIW